MIIGSHNSWSYLKPKKWWMRLFAFMAKCQNLDIISQYNKGIRCFDLRIRFDKNAKLIVAHGLVEYDINVFELYKQLTLLNSKNDNTIYIRVVHEVRTWKQYCISNPKTFANKCGELENMFPNIKFWCGKNLFDWHTDYQFKYSPTCEEKYSSVCPPKWIDDWLPWIYARLNNKKILKKGTDKDILLIDYVNIAQEEILC